MSPLDRKLDITQIAYHLMQSDVTLVVRVRWLSIFSTHSLSPESLGMQCHWVEGETSDSSIKKGVGSSAGHNQSSKSVNSPSPPHALHQRNTDPPSSSIERVVNDSSDRGFSWKHLRGQASTPVVKMKRTTAPQRSRGMNADRFFCPDTATPCARCSGGGLCLSSRMAYKGTESTGTRLSSRRCAPEQY